MRFFFHSSAAFRALEYHLPTSTSRSVSALSSSKPAFKPLALAAVTSKSRVSPFIAINESRRSPKMACFLVGALLEVGSSPFQSPRQARYGMKLHHRKRQAINLIRPGLKLLKTHADNIHMNVSGSSISDSLINQAMGLQSNNLGLQFSTAILKNLMDSQKQQGQALVAMICQTPSLDGTGQNIDIRA